MKYADASGGCGDIRKPVMLTGVSTVRGPQSRTSLAEEVFFAW